MKALKTYSKETVDGVLSRYKTEVRKILDEETKKIFLKQAQDVDVITLFTLHEAFGFGKDRLTRFAEKLLDIHNYYENRYSDDDIFAMQLELEKLGVDIDKLEKSLIEGDDKSAI